MGKLWKSSDSERDGGKILLRSNYGGVRCGKEKMPKRFRKSEAKLRIFIAICLTNDRLSELNSAAQKRRSTCQPL